MKRVDCLDFGLQHRVVSSAIDVQIAVSYESSLVPPFVMPRRHRHEACWNQRSLESKLWYLSSSIHESRGNEPGG